MRETEIRHTTGTVQLRADTDGKRLNLTNTGGEAYIKVRDLGTSDVG